MDRSKLFHGIAVVIDDEIDDPKSGVGELREKIVEAGCHVVPLKALPMNESIANLREVAFVVLDWNLRGAEFAELGVQIPADLRDQGEKELMDFLKQLKKTRFAPVFIFTNEPVDKITEKLEADTDLFDQNDPSHIQVMSKSDVLSKGIFEVLDEWLRKTPSVFVLKSWERQYERAKNELFLDFYTKSTIWPLVLWECFEMDSVSPNMALSEIITSNILSRTSPFDCDLEPYRPLLELLEADAHSEAIINVLEGERFLAKERLDSNSIQTGDIFQLPGGRYFINIRPICDSIPRDGKALDEMEIYALKGSKITKPALSRDFNRPYGQFNERDNQAVVFPVAGGIGLVFNFKELEVMKWADVKDRRVGRLLPPVLTKLQQRYASYLQRPGLTRLPTSAIPEPVGQEQEGSDAGSDEGGDISVMDSPGCLMPIKAFFGFIKSRSTE